MKTRKSHRPARSALAAGLALTASSLTIAAAATAEPATGGRYELAQRGPGAGQQQDDDRDQRKGKHKGKHDGRQDGSSDQNRDRGNRDGGPRSRGGEPGPRARGDENGQDRGQRFKNVQPQPQPQLQQQAPQAVQPDARPKSFTKEQNDQRDGSGERRFRKDVERPLAPAPNQRSGVGEPAPSTFKKPDSATTDRRDKGGREFFGQGRTNNTGASDGDRKRWRRDQRDAERSGGYANIDALKSSRKERRLEGGATIFEEPDSRRIIHSGNRSFIIRDETRRLSRFGKVTDTHRRPGGGNITTIVRPDGARIITETSPDGRLIRRYRKTRDGRTIILVDNRRTWRTWGAIGAGAVLATGLYLAIDPPHYRGPRDRYIIEYDHASYDDIYDALMAPPIDDIGPRYTLDQVLFNYNLRERMRRVDLDSINFETGSWDIDESQFEKLERLARAIDRILDRNPDEVFLIEGHTDAVGDAVSNRSLSDRRAEEVANILTEEFKVPPENLVIQGYGEEFLKVDTEGPSRANRRVTVRRITPLLDRRDTSYRD